MSELLPPGGQLKERTAGQIIATQVGAWQQDTLNVAAGAPQGASAPFGYVTPDGAARVVYWDVNFNITELYLPGEPGSWHSDTLNVTAGGAPYAASVPRGYVTPDGAARVVYRDVNQNVTELYLPGEPGSWHSDTLNVAAGGAPQAAVGDNAPFGYVTADGTARVIYRDVNNNITEIYLTSRGWVADTLNANASDVGAPQAASAPFGYVTPDGTARVIYRDVNNNITEIYLTSRGWVADTLNANASDVGAPQAASAPFGYVTPDGTARVIYQDVNNNITEIYLTSRGWVADTLNAAAGAPQAAGAPRGYVTPDGTARVIYQDVNNNITELYLTPGQHWQSDTLNVAAGGAPQPASAPFGYVTPDGTARVIYQDVNNNITELYLT